VNKKWTIFEKVDKSGCFQNILSFLETSHLREIENIICNPKVGLPPTFFLGTHVPLVEN